MNDKSLNTLVSSLKEDDYRAYTDKVRCTFDKIFRVLQDNSKFKLDRCRLVGGLAKKTSLWINADADLVIFYNGQQDKKMILYNFQDILVNHFPSLSDENIRTTPNMVMKFKLDNIPIDLVVAENNIYGHTIHGNYSTAEMQREYSLAKFKSKENKMTVAELGFALTESSVEFIKKQSNFVHDVVLLAKYWNDRILFKHYVYGRSLIMELLATSAAIIEQNCNIRPSIENAFKRFLEMISNLQKQYVVFHENLAYYKKSDVPKDILEQRPLLLDPINPYNNLLNIRRNTNLKHLFHVYEDAADAVLNMIKNGCKELKQILSSQPGCVINQRHGYCDRCGSHDHARDKCTSFFCQCSHNGTLCGLMFYTEASYKLHLKTHRPATHSCPACEERRFASTGGVVTHFESGGCSACRGTEKARETAFQFLRKNEETRHLLTQGALEYKASENETRPEFPYKCSHCSRQFKLAGGLIQHTEHQHGNLKINGLLKALK